MKDAQSLEVEVKAMEYGEVAVGIRDTEDVVLAELALSPVQAQALIGELTEALDTVDPEGTERHRPQKPKNLEDWLRAEGYELCKWDDDQGRYRDQGAFANGKSLTELVEEFEGKGRGC